MQYLGLLLGSMHAAGGVTEEVASTYYVQREA